MAITAPFCWRISIMNPQVIASQDVQTVTEVPPATVWRFSAKRYIPFKFFLPRFQRSFTKLFKSWIYRIPTKYMFKSYVHGRIPMFTFYSVLRAVFQILGAEINQNISKSVLKITPNQDNKSEKSGRSWVQLVQFLRRILWNPSGKRTHRCSQHFATNSEHRGYSRIIWHLGMPLRTMRSMLCDIFLGCSSDTITDWWLSHQPL